MRSAGLCLLITLLCGSAVAASQPAAIGEMETYQTTKEDDTLIEIAYREDIGYVELRAANPHLDPWLPGANEEVILPKRHLLPDGPRSGILVNVGEMRLYYFPKNGPIQSYPLGIGREGLLTPLGTTNVVRKATNPTWYPTERMRREKPELPAVVPPGPDNPMGPRAMYLGFPLVAIHGTNRPWGIGRRVSSGCLRMYNQDIKALYDQIPVGTRVTVIDQPVKAAWIDGVFYIEAHPNAKQADAIQSHETKNIQYEVSDSDMNAIMKKAGDHAEAIDWGKVRKALRNRPSYPVAVSRTVKDKRDETAEVKQAESKEEESARESEKKAAVKEAAKKEKPAGKVVKSEAPSKKAPSKKVKTEKKEVEAKAAEEPPLPAEAGGFNS